jgi:hypothetical protein
MGLKSGSSVACRGPHAFFLVTGTDSSGRIILRRESVEAARKKAAELAEDGCHDISITTPDRQRYPPQAFDRLPPDS